MRDRLLNIVLIVLLALLAVYVAEPYVTRYFYAAESPRLVEPRGDLAASERATI